MKKKIFIGIAILLIAFGIFIYIRYEDMKTYDILASIKINSEKMQFPVPVINTNNKVWLTNATVDPHNLLVYYYYTNKYSKLENELILNKLRNDPRDYYSQLCKDREISTMIKYINGVIMNYSAETNKGTETLSMRVDKDICQKYR